LNVPSSAPPPVEAVPPLPARFGWAVLIAGAGLCLLAAAIGLIIDLSALANPPAATESYPSVEGGPTLAERLKWASGQAGQEGSPGELRQLHYEIGRTTPFSTPRIGMVGLGVLAAAAGVWVRRGHWVAWLAGAAAAGLGVFGLPMHWDSIRLLFGVLAVLGAFAALLAYVRPVWRYSLLVVVVLFHFGGILTAVTWPDTQGRTPWLTNQSAARVYLPYFRFMYLSNAYHFYSPDPGPASKFCVLVEYEVYRTVKDPRTGEHVPDVDPQTGEPVAVTDPKTNKPRAVAEWVELPKRRLNYRDPLGLTYYRRLSLTELASYSAPGTMLPPSWEKADVMQRRTQNERDLSGRQVSVPGATTFNEVDLTQYRQPHTPTRRAVLPSYARHIASEYTKPRTEAGAAADGRAEERVYWYKVTGMKMFRVEHRIIESQQFLAFDNPDYARMKERNPQAQLPGPLHKPGLSPYHPAVYHPYYLGEFAADGRLKDPNDPLLYWLTPVQYTPNRPNDEPDYTDWMSKYARHEFIWEGKE
jgi:hypothetical protein